MRAIALRQPLHFLRLRLLFPKNLCQGKSFLGALYKREVPRARFAGARRKESPRRRKACSAKDAYRHPHAIYACVSFSQKIFCFAKSLREPYLILSTISALRVCMPCGYKLSPAAQGNLACSIILEIPYYSLPCVRGGGRRGTSLPEGLLIPTT